MRFAVLVVFALGLLSCVSRSNDVSNSVTETLIDQDVFNAYMSQTEPIADGFDFPVGDTNGKGNYIDKVTGGRHSGWTVATKFGEHYSLGIHPGEDWNGGGGGDTDLGQDVYAVARGRVVFAQDFGQPWGNMVVVDHTYFENFERRKVRSLYGHLLDISVSAGETVERRQLVGHIGKDPEQSFPAHLHLEFRFDMQIPPTYWPSSNGKDDAWVAEHYTSPTDFINAHRTMFNPTTEKTLVLVDQESYKMRLYSSSVLQGEYDISLGQSKGQKLIEGDNKTPKGMYFVTNKHRGQFDGEYGAYYGGHWIKINYPNKYDAERGLDEGKIDGDQAKQIVSNWRSRKLTLENTALGGGIGFHGWIKEWDNAGPRHLSWGCVVMHIRDITDLYDRIPENSMVVIF